MFLHSKVLLLIDGEKQFHFNLGLQLWQKFFPDIGVGGWCEVREAEA